MTLIKDWVTSAGYRAAITFVNESHHCGYVAIPSTHPLFQIGYSATVPGLVLPKNEPIGKRGVIPLLCASSTDITKGTTPDVYFDVHGGVTFSGFAQKGYPAPDEQAKHLWWFGFDCAHAGDFTKGPHAYNPSDAVWRDVDYVTQECESLARQLADVEIIPTTETSNA